MIKEFQSSSLLDFLEKIMPDFKGQIVFMRRPSVDNKAVNKLFALWKDEKNVIEGKSIRKPVTCSSEDILLMEREGLIKQHGDKLKVTQKGADVIKTMILGDDKSVWENGEMDFAKAYANTRPKTKTAKIASLNETNWYASRVKYA